MIRMARNRGIKMSVSKVSWVCFLSSHSSGSCSRSRSLLVSYRRAPLPYILLQQEGSCIGVCKGGEHVCDFWMYYSYMYSNGILTISPLVAWSPFARYSPSERRRAIYITTKLRPSEALPRLESRLHLSQAGPLMLVVLGYLTLHLPNVPDQAS